MHLWYNHGMGKKQQVTGKFATQEELIRNIKFARLLKIPAKMQAEKFGLSMDQLYRISSNAIKDGEMPSLKHRGDIRVSQWGKDVPFKPAEWAAFLDAVKVLRLEGHAARVYDRLVKLLDLAPERRYPTLEEKQAERNQQMYALHLEGKTLREIAEQYGVTYQRVQQIIRAIKRKVDNPIKS